jgi:hypothetical protein
VPGERREQTEADRDHDRRTEQLGDAFAAVRADGLRDERFRAAQKADAEADEREPDDAGEADTGKLVGTDLRDERGRRECHRRKRDHRDRDRPCQAQERAPGTIGPGQRG